MHLSIIVCLSKDHLYIDLLSTGVYPSGYWYLSVYQLVSIRPLRILGIKLVWSIDINNIRSGGRARYYFTEQGRKIQNKYEQVWTASHIQTTLFHHTRREAERES